MSKKILITGVSGFVGSRLAARCVSLGYEVHAFVRSQSNLWRIQSFQDKLQLHEVDLLDQASLDKALQTIKPEWVFHLACYGGFPQENDEAKIIQVNTLGSYYLLNACTDINVEQFVYVGSSSEYGIKDVAMKESDLERPANIYGCAKLAVTNLTRFFAEQQRLPTTILRIFSVYGPYEAITRFVPSVILACLRKKELKLTSGKQPRDFIFVEDIVDALLVAANKSAGNGEILNVGTGKQTSIREMTSLILELCGNPIVPQWGAIPDRPNEPTCWVADASKFHTTLGWKAQHDLRSGLEKTISWFKTHLDLYEE